MLYIIPDTNLFSISYSRNVVFNRFEMNKNFKELIALAGDTSICDDFTILIPQIVVMELERQRVQAFEKAQENLSELLQSFGEYTKVCFSDEYDHYSDCASQQIREYLGGFSNVEIMPICPQDYFGSIIQKAIKKEAPFEGKDKQSDKGFKDTVIFFSMVAYAGEHEGRYYYLSRDNRFHGAEEQLLRTQFEELSGQTLKIYNDISLIKGELIRNPGIMVDCVELRFEEKDVVFGLRKGEVPATVNLYRLYIESDIPAAAMMNHDIAMLYEDFLSWWKGLDYKTDAECADMEYSGCLRAMVRYNARGLLSIVFFGNTYTGGLHDDPFLKTRLYNVNSGEQVRLVDLVGKDSNVVLEDFKKAWERKKKQLQSYDYFEDFVMSYTLADDIKFYLAKEGIIAYFDVYEAGPFASGIIEFLLYEMGDVKFK